MNEFGHSLLGGSGAKRWLNCSGSFLLARELQAEDELENITSSYAELGTSAHTLASCCLEQNHEPWMYYGVEHSGYFVGKEIELDPVSIFVNHCLDIESQGEGKRLVEGELELPGLHPLLKGTVDFAFYAKDKRLWVSDYKHGAGVPVSPQGNEQMLYYAFLMVKLWDLPDTLPVTLSIVQPRYDTTKPYMSWNTDVKYVREFGENTLLKTMHELTRTEDVSNEDFNPGDWCQFCPVLLECPIMQSSFKAYIREEEDTIMLTDEELSDYFATSSQVKKFLTALENTTKSRLMSGRIIASAKLVDNNPNRAWKEGAEEALVAKIGEKAYKKSLKSPAEIGKLTKVGAELVAEFAYKPDPTGKNVVLATDPREGKTVPSSSETFSHYEF